MAITYTPNMNLTLPGVGTEYGPAWATEINGDLSVLDSHNHNPGSGVQITPTGLNINIDLSFAQNNAINLRSSRYVAQSGVLTGASDLNCSYSVGSNGELYWNDAVGHRVQITNSGNVNAGAGSITGLPSGTASVAFNSVSQTYVFQSATSTAAILDARSIIIRNGTSGSYGITLQAPTLSSNYSITLPTLPASVNSFMTINSAGIITATMPATFYPVTIQKFTSGSGTYTTPVSPAPIYIKVRMVGGGGGGGGYSPSGTDGSYGGNTTFSTFLSCTGGEGGPKGAAGNISAGAGGTATLTSPAIGIVVLSGSVGGSGTSPPGAGYSAGGVGGTSPFGAAGGAYSYGSSAAANSGSGGGGGGEYIAYPGCGGGAGGYIEAIINAPAASYSYSIGAGGTGGTYGGNGGSGVIIVEEHYQ